MDGSILGNWYVTGSYGNHASPEAIDDNDAYYIYTSGVVVLDDYTSNSYGITLTPRKKSPFALRTLNVLMTTLCAVLTRMATSETTVGASTVPAGGALRIHVILLFGGLV